MSLRFFPVQQTFLFLLIVVISSGLPDLDSGKSVFSRKTKLVSWVFRIFRHRGMMHSLFFALALSFIFIIFGQKEIAFGFLVGYGSHLFLDSLTKEGIRLFYPLKFRFRGFVKTNGLFEKVFFAVIFLLDVYLLWKLLL